MLLSHQKPIIWIIDDDLICQFASAYKLEQAKIKCEVKSYSSGIEGVKVIEDILKSDARLPDAILLDLQMPVMDGWAFLEILNNLGGGVENIAIYLVSYYFKSTHVVKDLNDKFVRGHFTKPLGQNDVVKIIASLQN